MRILSVQFQPRLSPGLSVAKVIALTAERIAGDSAVSAFEVSKGNDRGPYVNFQLTVQNRKLVHLWRLVRSRLLNHPSLGPRLRRGTIVTCQGSRGWDNYLLLHHFDPKVPLDIP